MQKLGKTILVILGLVTIGLGIYFIWDYFTPEKEPVSTGPESTKVKEEVEKETTDYEKFKNTHFGGGGSESEDFEAMAELGVRFKRIGAGIMTTGPKALFAWDEQLKKAQEKGIWLMGIIDPASEPPGSWPTSEYFASEFQKIVERYDNDGQDDMEDLKYPIKYYEIANEIETGGALGPMPGGFNPWQDFSNEDYLAFFNATYQAMKEACSDCLLAPGSFVDGGLSRAFRYLASKVEKEKIGFISYHSYQEYLDVDDLMKSLAELDLTEKPIFITESQFGGMMRQEPFSQEEIAKIQTRSYVYALAKGIDKLMPSELKVIERFPEGLKWSCLIDQDGTKRPSFYAYQTLIKKLDYFTDVRELSKYQYEFTVNDKPIYVLWGNEPLADYLTTLTLEEGTKIMVTDIEGKEQELTSLNQLKLTDSPIFVEIK